MAEASERKPFDKVEAACLDSSIALGFDREVRLLVRGILLLRLWLTGNFLMMDNFFSTLNILNVRRAGNTGGCICACIILAMNTVFAVASGSTAYGVP